MLKGNRQFLKKICNYLKIFYIPFSTLQNYPTQQLKFKIIGPESLERLIERHANASKEESVIDADGARKIVIRTKLKSVKFLQSQVFMKTFILCSHVLGNKKVHPYHVPSWETYPIQ